MIENTKLGDDFSLEFISARLVNFRIPEKAFDPNGDWDLNYGVYTFTALRQGPTPGGLVGHMKLARKRINEREAEISLDYEKDGPGTTQRVAGTIRCGTDALSTPSHWKYSAEVVDSEGKLYENSKISKRGHAGNGRIEIEDDCGTRRLSINGPFTINWAIWDAVMRLPRESTKPLCFTMLDHFDQLKYRQRLAFREAGVLTLGQHRVKEESWEELEKGRIRQTRWNLVGGSDVTLHGFEQLGEGIVPWIYWTDDQGRLLFVVSGLEVYILDSWQEA